MALQLHFKDQVSEYGSQHIMNLVNDKGYKKPIKDTFEHYITEVHALTYILVLSHEPTVELAP